MSEVSRVALFSGREGKNNQKIMKLLCSGPLNRHQIANELHKKYTTIFDRVDRLKEEGILKIEELTKAKYSERPTFALDCRGLYLAALYSPDIDLRKLASAKCGEMLRQAWRVFSEVYEIDAERSQPIERWISSDDGVRSILQYFRDHKKLDSEARMLIEYRRMIDLGIMLHRSVIARIFSLHDLEDMTEADKTAMSWGIEINSLEKLLIACAELAYNHPKLRKLYDAVAEADAPLITRFDTQVVLALEEETQAKERKGQAI